MKKIIFMLIFSSIFSLLGCKSEEEKFLENHKVFPCSPEIVQETCLNFFEELGDKP
ncbi:hypothetical protein [Capnocytophaga sp. G2]|uniref:hypothetical protein n=1 Tax=Capnocytophaga sp. G2 TaxID=3110695 RepID=UPI002B46D428|nr:hypothetical protein [Capnocytophaga sp. G2]MEB3005960.1 hypothetical protein [Capnocytophaga sp. G2]